MTTNELAYVKSLMTHRDNIIKEEEFLKEVEKRERPPVVQEIILARRHLEDARMRLRIAVAMIEDSDK
jgi:hypothetical protein